MLYTIGHGARKADDFLVLLKENGIDYLIDVRSQPYSRFHPQFSRNALKDFLEQYDIRYVFMGDQLGGRPQDPACYTNGRIDYEKVKQQDFYRAGIERLKTAAAKGLKAAIMCSERRPEDCHRMKLVAETLTEEGVEVVHIDEKGELRAHPDRP